MKLSHDEIAAKVVKELEDQGPSVDLIHADNTPAPDSQFNLPVITCPALAEHLGLPEAEFTARAERLACRPIGSVSLDGRKTEVFDARFVPIYRHFLVTLWNQYAR